MCGSNPYTPPSLPPTENLKINPALRLMQRWFHVGIASRNCRRCTSATWRRSCWNANDSKLICRRHATKRSWICRSRLIEHTMTRSGIGQRPKNSGQRPKNSRNNATDGLNHAMPVRTQSRTSNRQIENCVLHCVLLAMRHPALQCGVGMTSPRSGTRATIPSPARNGMIIKIGPTVQIHGQLRHRTGGNTME